MSRSSILISGLSARGLKIFTKEAGGWVSIICGVFPERSRKPRIGGLRVAVENTAQGKIEHFDLDMLVLAVGLNPSDSTRKLQEMLGLAADIGWVFSGSTSQASARGCGNARGFLRRMRRRA